MSNKQRKISILRLPAVMARTGQSRSWIYQQAKDGKFPKQVKIGPRCSGWIEEEIDDYLDLRIRVSRGEGK